MKSRVEEAVKRKMCGYNCAQAVACTYCDYAGVDEDTMKNISQAFGTGMGTLEGNCGAIAGAGIVLGMANKKPAKTIQDTREIMAEFKNRNGAVTCKTLKGIDTGVVLRECNDCVRDAAEFLEQQLHQI
ncbi:MAG: C_GCAxxG_C_C family protein [Lachnospiraceae bacterium]|nr:C_GCAxxG_C_C family protein [Lachnospiraceae bacterium]